MRLLRLELEGYRQFRSRAEIKFPERGLIGIVGPNGAGKSKIVEAICYALFGPRGDHLPQGDFDADLRSYGSRDGDSFLVALEYEVGQDRYRVERDRGRVKLFELGAGRVQLTGATAVTHAIQRRLNLKSATFLGTFVAKQRDVIGLQKEPSDKRTRLVNELIGVAQVELALSQATIAVAGSGKAATDARAALGTPSRDAKATVRGQDIALRQAERQAERTERTQRTLQDHLAAAMRDQQSLDSRVERAKGMESRIELLDRTIGDLETRESTLVAHLAQLDDAATKLSRLENQLADLTGAEEALGQLDQLRVLQERRATVARLDTLVMGPLARKLKSRNRLQRQEEVLLLNIERVEKAIAAGSEHRAVATSTLEEREKSLSDAKTRRQKLAEAGESGRCDVCQAPLGRRYQRVFAASERDEITLSDQVERLRKAALGYSERHSRLVRRRSEVGAELDRVRQLLRNEFGSIEGEITAARRQLDDVRAQVQVDEGNVATMVRNVRWTQRLHTAARERLVRKRALEVEAVGLRGILSSRTSVDAQLRTTRSTLEGRTQELKRILAERSVTMPRQIDLRRVQARVQAARDRVRSIDEQVKNVRTELGGLRANADTAHRALAEALQKEGMAEAAERDLQIALQTRLHLSSLLRELMDEARPLLARYMREWMGPLFEGRFSDVELTSDYRIMADNGSGMREIFHFSGGEQTILAIMLRAAISLFCRERANFETGFLILDEVFGEQDFHRRLGLVQFLEEVKPHYHQILVVNHIAEIDGYFDSVIEVIQTGRNTSRIAVR